MKIVRRVPPVVGKDQVVALDIEVYGQENNRLHRPTGTFACLSVCIVGQTTVYQITDTADLKELVKNLRLAKHWVFHNALYDIRQLRRWVKIPEVHLWDTMLVERHLFGGYYDFFSLSALVRRWLAVPMAKETREEFITETVMSPEMAQYAALDAMLTAQVYQKQVEYIKTDDVDMTSYEIDQDAVWAILAMPPVKVDSAAWMRQVATFETESDRLESELGFNSKSPVKVREAINALLPRKEHITSTSKSKVLEPFVTKYADKYPDAVALVNNIITSRRYRDACSKYGRDWVAKYVEKDDLVYPNWKVTGAETGRMSCDDPNLQQIPSRDLPVYRTFFVPRAEDRVMLVADVSQQEPRILGWYSKDKRLLDSIYANADLHLDVTRAVFHDETLTKKSPLRRVGKAINLGLGYGLTSFGLARNLGISEEEAERHIRAYMLKFRGVASWQSSQKRQGFLLEYVRTAAGRRVWINRYAGDWENTTINAPIQGTAAEHTKQALSLLYKECKKRKIEFPVVLIIHDEFVLDIPKDMIEVYTELVNKAFIDSGALLVGDIPMVVNTDTGESWGAKE